MFQAHSYLGVCRVLADRYENDYPQRAVNITGLIFGNPNTPLGKAEYLPVIDYWHHRSDNITDFFCGGFGEYGVVDPPDAQPVPEIRHAKWWFSSEILAALTADIEQRSSWKPSGGFDVIICTARHNKEDKLTSLDFSSAICINVEDAKRDKAIRDLSHLLTMLFEFAKSINEGTTDATWQLSDATGIYVLKQTLTEMVLSWIPKWLGTGARKAKHFAVHDIALPATD